MSLAKSGSKLSEWLEKLRGLRPGEDTSTIWVGVKSFNPYWTTCGENFLYKKVHHIRRVSGTGLTVRDESVGSDREEAKSLNVIESKR